MVGGLRSRKKNEEVKEGKRAGAYYVGRLARTRFVLVVAARLVQVAVQCGLVKVGPGSRAMDTVSAPAASICMHWRVEGRRPQRSGVPLYVPAERKYTKRRATGVPAVLHGLSAQ